MKTYAIYFSSREKMACLSTRRYKRLLSDYTVNEVEAAAKLAGCEGFAIVKNGQLRILKWFVDDVSK